MAILIPRRRHICPHRCRPLQKHQLRLPPPDIRKVLISVIFMCLPSFLRLSTAMRYVVSSVRDIGMIRVTMRLEDNSSAK